MKNILKYIFVFFLFNVFSCKECELGSSDIEIINGKYIVSFYILNASNNLNLYSQLNSCDSIGVYCPDSLKLFDKNFNQISINYSTAPYGTGYIFNGFVLYDESIDYLAKSQTISKKYYMKLNNLDIDTIEIKYCLKKNKKCNNYIMENGEVIYNLKNNDNLYQNLSLIYFKK